MTDAETLPPEFEDRTIERLETEVAMLKAKVATLKAKVDMMFQCVKALSEDRKVIVHNDGRIFVQPPSIVAN